MKRRDLVIAESAGGLRLDQAIARSVPDISRRRARMLVESGRVFVAGQRAKIASRPVEAGTRVTLHEGEVEQGAEPGVLHEDAEILVIDKPAGRVVNATETQAGEAIVEELAGGRRQELFVIHRIDREVSGVVVLAKTRAACARLSEAFRAREVEKRYLAIVEGGDPGVERIEAKIAIDPRRPRARRVHESGKAACTLVKLIGTVAGISALAVQPVTGRTHQIRVHLAHIGRPIVGDTLYGGPSAVRIGGEVVRPGRVMLHARRITVPLAGGRRAFEAPLPADMEVFRRHGLALEAAYD